MSFTVHINPLIVIVHILISLYFASYTNSFFVASCTSICCISKMIEDGKTYLYILLLYNFYATVDGSTRAPKSFSDEVRHRLKKKVRCYSFSLWIIMAHDVVGWIGGQKYLQPDSLASLF